jgi:hypothetical protein
VALLIDAGADVNASRKDGCVRSHLLHPPHTLTKHIALPCVLSVGSRSINRSTALFICAQEGYVEIMEMLIMSHADAEKRRHDGASALDIAKQEGHKQCTQLLKVRYPFRTVTRSRRSHDRVLDRSVALLVVATPPSSLFLFYFLFLFLFLWIFAGILKEQRNAHWSKRLRRRRWCSRRGWWRRPSPF